MQTAAEIDQRLSSYRHICMCMYDRHMTVCIGYPGLAPDKSAPPLTMTTALQSLTNTTSMSATGAAAPSSSSSSTAASSSLPPIAAVADTPSVNLQNYLAS